MLNAYEIDRAKMELKSHENELSNNDFSWLENSYYKREVVAYMYEIKFPILKYVDTIYGNMFSMVDGSLIKRLNIPNNIKEVYNGGFNSCTATEIVFNNYNIRVLPPSLFEYNHYLQRITLPSNIRIIPSNCFDNCNNLKEIMIPDSVEIIGRNAFRGCDDVKITANYRTMKKIKAPKTDIEFLKSHLSFIHSSNEEDEDLFQ